LLIGYGMASVEKASRYQNNNTKLHTHTEKKLQPTKA